MDGLKNKLMVIHTLTMLVLAWLCWYAMKQYMPENYFQTYPIMPVVFYVVGFAFIHIMVRIKKKEPLKIANLYMGLKMAKMLIFIVMVVLLMLDKAVDNKTLLIVFSIFYVVYTSFETFAFYQIERRLKREE